MFSEKVNIASDKPITAVMEDYLEAIFNLSKVKKVVRVKDIAERLGVKMPTVTSMLKSLNDRSLVDYEKYEYVELTDEGKEVGKEVHRRHLLLRKFLTDILKIELETADEEACKIEHTLSFETLNSLADFMKFLQTFSCDGQTCLRCFEEYRRQGFNSSKGKGAKRLDIN